MSKPKSVKKHRPPGPRAKSNSDTPTGGISDEGMRALEEALKKAREEGTLPPTAIDIEGLLDLAKKNLVSPSLGQPLESFVPYALPTSTSAVLLSLFDPSLENLPEIAKMFEARGYKVAPSHTIDLATLRRLPNQPIGVLYIHTHGLESVRDVPDQQPPIDRIPDASAPESNPLVFGLATADSADVPPESVRGPAGVALRADIKAKRVVVGPADFYTRDPELGIVGSGHPRNVYFATTDFFDYYWKGKVFAENSFVFITGCYSADDRFVRTITKASAGMILGWTFPVATEDSSRTADYIFDRLLGTNNQKPEFFPEKLRQRPFDWGMILQDLKNHRSSLGNQLGTSVTAFRGADARSILSPVENKAGVLLVPAITYLRVDEPSKRLYIQGDFGPDPGPRGTVTRDP